MKRYLIALSLVGLVTTSCYEKLNITPPNSITNEQVLKLLETADDKTIVTIMGAMADALPGQINGGGYDQWGNQYVSNFAGQLCCKDFTGNDVVVGKEPPTGDLGNFYAGLGVREYTSGMNYPYWKRGYTMIGAANKVTDLLTDELLAKNSSKMLREYKGRALLIRAFGYNYLIENYQDSYLQGGKDKPGVPIYVHFSNSQPLVARSSVKVVYDSIIKWTKTAISLYEEAGVGYTKGDADAWRDIDMGVAKYILARAALNMGDYVTTIAACNDILAEYPTLIAEEDYVARNLQTPATNPVNWKIVPEYRAENLALLKLDKNPEVLLGWENTKYGTFGAQVNWFNFYGEMRIDDRLYKQIDPRDFRRDNFLDATEYGPFVSPTYYKSYVEDPSLVQPAMLASYLNFKWASTVGINGTYGSLEADQWRSGATDVCFIRTSEVLLMKAEAEAQSGGDWKTTLNKLLAARTKSGKTVMTCDDYAGSLGKSPLEQVQLQWRIEMWGEVGIEWYNNRRWNLPVNRQGSTIHHNPAMTYSVASMTLQIPEQEINTNNLIVQNP